MKAERNSEFLDRLVSITRDLLNQKGRRDVHFTEIADVFFQGAFFGEGYQAVRSRILLVRDILEEDGMFTIPVSRDYFGITSAHERTAIPRPRKTKTLEELNEIPNLASRCLPMGRSKGSHGLYRPLEVDDPIEKAVYVLSTAQTKGRLNNTVKRLDTAQSLGRMTAPHVENTIMGALPRRVVDSISARSSASAADSE